MAIQELYNKLRLKREYANKDVALRLTTNELEILLMGLNELGADIDTGYQYVLDFKKEADAQSESDAWLQKHLKDRESQE